MKYTYDLNTNGCLIITCTHEERRMIRGLRDPKTKEFDSRAEADALESLLANSNLGWVAPEEIGALTSAPILGIRNDVGEPLAAWGFMDYQVRSFLSDLVDNGKAVFIS
jgi:hypothetical protein